MSADATPDQLRTARWVGALFLLVVLTQRFAVPGLPLALLVPVVVVWVLAALGCGVVVIDRTRLALWLAAAGVTGLVMPVQSALVPGAQISVTAWGLLVVVWLPFAVRVVHGGPPAYLAMLRYAVSIATGLAALAVAMAGSQLAGLGYRDWFAALVPQPLQLTGFVITYPIAYGSTVLRANAWIGLEPSIVSAQLGLGLVAAIFVRARLWKIALLIVGLVATVSGSGIAIVAVGVLVMLVHRSRRLVFRYLPIAAVVAVAAAATPIGALLFARLTEFKSADSSTSLRAVQPYELLFPRWRSHLSGMLLGYGPGSSQRVVNDTNIVGLLVPSPIKVFFEYGLLPGLVLAGFLLLCYWGGPSRAFGLSLLASLWLLQPGTTTMVVVAPLLVFVSLWSPRTGPPIEELDPSTPMARHLPVGSTPEPPVRTFTSKGVS